MSTLMGFYLYGLACLVGGFYLGILWKDRK
jgi:hypothetical protein